MYIQELNFGTFRLGREVVAADEVPAPGPGGSDTALPGKVVTQPVHADVEGRPAIRSLPHHRATVQLGVQRGLGWKELDV